MKTLRFTPLALLVATGMSLSACQEKEVIEVKEHVSGEVLEQIQAHGYSTVGVQKVADGYVVEGDILLSPQELASQPDASQVGSDEQYWSGRKVGKPSGNKVRTIRVKLQSGTFGVNRLSYNRILDEAINKLNGAKRELDLYIDFKKVGSNEQADIAVRGDGTGGGGRAVFPTGGNPGTTIYIDAKSINKNSSYTVGGIANLVAHEMGHTIGFRHTDAKAGSIGSCSGTKRTADESNGNGEFGTLNHIPGTTTKQDQSSWMSGCMNFSVARGAFIQGDKVALSYLYKRLK